MITADDFRKEIGKIFVENKYDDSLRYKIYVCIEMWLTKRWGKIPYLYDFGDGPEDEDDLDFDIDKDVTSNKPNNKTILIDFSKTIKKIRKEFPQVTIVKPFGTDIEDSLILDDEFLYYRGNCYVKDMEKFEEIRKCFVEKPIAATIRWVLRDCRGYVTERVMKVSPMSSFEENYNDDFFPIHDKITKLLKEESSSVIILHGKPGTGKTSYIRHLIHANKDLSFYWVDCSMFNYLDSKEFVDFVSDNRNGIFILEDAEAILKSREGNNNSAMQSLLSISDGLLGDSLHLKFICTFNTDLVNIDKAILRKGRLKAKYEFKDLSKEKVKAIFKSKGIDENLAKEMPLCDVYNFLEDNGTEDNGKKQIGFQF
jgi:hypothetical protein